MSREIDQEHIKALKDRIKTLNEVIQDLREENERLVFKMNDVIDDRNKTAQDYNNILDKWEKEKEYIEDLEEANLSYADDLEGKPNVNLLRYNEMKNCCNCRQTEGYKDKCYEEGYFYDVIDSLRAKCGKWK